MPSVRSSIPWFAGLACTNAAFFAPSGAPDSTPTAEPASENQPDPEKEALLKKKLDLDDALKISEGNEEKARVLNARIVGSSMDLIKKFADEHNMWLRRKYEHTEGRKVYEEKVEEFNNLWTTDKEKAIQKMVLTNRGLRAHPRPTVTLQFGYWPEDLLRACYGYVMLCAICLLVSACHSPPPRGINKPEHMRTKQEQRYIARYNGFYPRLMRFLLSTIFSIAVCVAYLQQSFVTFDTQMREWNTFQYKVALGVIKLELYSPKLGEEVQYPQALGTLMKSEMEIDLLSEGGLVEGGVTRDPFDIPAQPGSDWWRGPLIFSCFIAFLTGMGAAGTWRGQETTQ